MRIVFMGTPQSAVPTLQRCLQDAHEVVAVWTQPDRPSGRGNRVTASPVKEFALSRGLTVHQPARIKNQDTLQLFKSHNADAGVVVAYGRILPQGFLEAPKVGCINVHFSLLPHYRGAAPVNWAIVKGEPETGVTTMIIEPELDSGPILLQRKTQIGETETAPDVLQRLSVMGAELLSETLKDLPKLQPKIQDHNQASLAPLLEKEHGLIRWSDDAVTIDRAIRGFQPWPNAYTTFQSHRLTLWRAQPTSLATTGSPGEIISAHGDDLIVACGEGTVLRLVEVQPEARKRMTSRDFLNGLHVKVGDRFGEK